MPRHRPSRTRLVVLPWPRLSPPRTAATLALGLLGLLAACGGGGGGGSRDDGARSGVTIDTPFHASALAAAPSDAVAYRAACSGNGPITYEWDPGDGSAPSLGGDVFFYSYAQEGEYLPRVTCKDAHGGQAISAAASRVRVAVPSHTLATVQSTVAARSATSTEVDFLATCLAEPGEEPGYAWDFGDGQTATGPNVRHSYRHDNGSVVATRYRATAFCTVARTLKDLAGQDTRAWQTVQGSTEVQAGPAEPPLRITQALAVDPHVPTTAGPTAFNTTCSAASGRVTYRFDFGDGFTKTGPAGTATHTYAPNPQRPTSQYTVRVECIDDLDRSASGTASQSLQVNVRTPALTLLAGNSGQPSTYDSLVIDPAGNFYVSNPSANTIVKRSAAGVSTPFAGTGVAGLVNGPGLAATFNTPTALAIGPDGAVYVADSGNRVIRRISPAGLVTTWAGNGRPGRVDGARDVAGFVDPRGLVVDASGTVYVSDGDSIRRISPQGGVITLAGQNGRGFQDGPAATARFAGPRGLALDAAGNLLVADQGNYAIRKISPSGMVSTLAGNGTRSTATNTFIGEGNGIGAAARFAGPKDIAVAPDGTAYVSDVAQIRTVSPAGEVGYVGSAGYVRVGGPDLLYSVTGLALDAAGRLFTVGSSANAISHIRLPGSSPFIDDLPVYGSGAADGTGGAAGFYFPTGIAFGATGDAYLADSLNFSIRRIGTDGQVRTVSDSNSDALRASVARFIGTTQLGASWRSGHGIGGPFRFPYSVVVDGAGNVYMATLDDNRIFKIDPAGTQSTFAGDETAGRADGVGPAARFNQPRKLGIDAAGNVYVADRSNHAIRKITPAGVVSTVAGSGSPGFADGTGTGALFDQPSAVAADAAGNLYVADVGNASVRKIGPGGVVTTLAGARAVPADIKSFATSALMKDLAVDRGGNVYVASDKAIRKISPTGEVTVLAIPLSPQLRAEELTVDGIAISGRRLVFTNRFSVAQIDFAP